LSWKRPKYFRQESKNMSDPTESHIRIVDIARMAGVSTATVDRVIHNRGKVSADSLRKIREVLDAVDYRPNLVARSLASGRAQVVGVVIPSFAEGEYWADVDAGIERAAAEAARFNISVRKFFFDQYNRASFEHAIAGLRDTDVDAVVVATLFAEQVVEFSHELDAEGTPFVFVDSDIAGCNRLAYFGTSSFDAGVVAGRLLLDKINLRSDIVVGSIVHKGDGGSNQWRHREIGFRSYLREAGFLGQLHTVSLRIGDDAYNAGVLDALFTENPRIEGAVTFNSTCYILGHYLRTSHRDVRLVGYDIIPRNEEMLREGIATALIAQRPEAQGYRAVTAVCEHLLGGPEILPVNHMPIDILLKENIGFYKNL